VCRSSNQVRSGEAANQVVSWPVTWPVYGLMYTVCECSKSSPGEEKSIWVVASSLPRRTSLMSPSGWVARAAAICSDSGLTASPCATTNSSA
jgi:hypothetical protein